MFILLNFPVVHFWRSVCQGQTGREDIGLERKKSIYKTSLEHQAICRLTSAAS